MISNNHSLKNQYTNLPLSQGQARLRETSFYPCVSTRSGTDSRARLTRITGGYLQTKEE